MLSSSFMFYKRYRYAIEANDMFRFALAVKNTSFSFHRVFQELALYALTEDSET